MVVVYGTVCLDRLRRVPRLPETGGYVEIQEELIALGGEAANTGAALVAWGARVRLVGNSLGEGPEADLIRRALDDAGLTDRALPDRCHPSPFCDIYVTPGSERTMFGRGFAEMEERHGLDLLGFEGCTWLAVDDNHGAAARRALTMGREAGVGLYALDFCRPNEPLGPDVVWQSSTDWSLTRGDDRRSRDWLAAWVERNGCLSILTDGVRGFWLAAPGRAPRLLPSFPCPAPLDSTGAGDAFRAGMLFGLQRGLDLADCLSFASAAGSMACTRLGGAAQAPTKDSILRLMNSDPQTREAHRDAAHGLTIPAPKTPTAPPTT
ncbi:MAG: carbohydrate kinase family protein [Fimbriimonadaceae bacterium]|nr:carbohydrate kinase family protein [Fimbriimonadaceae bacterium]